MAKKDYNVIGVMSGTSLDGVDLAFVKICTTPQYTAEIVAAITVPYSEDWVEKLRKGIHLNGDELRLLDEEYSSYLSRCIVRFISENDFGELDAVCSHGHTILHQPDAGLTLQIGNLPTLAAAVNQTVVCDFRVQDVALGGQGAPLVPIGDQLLFGDYGYCLNLGGFANVSSEKGGLRLAYDICPVNVVLNSYAELLGHPYDDGGAFANAGTVNPRLLEQLNALPFYMKSAPKSLGIEWVHAHVLPLLEASQSDPVEILATFTEHVAIQLAKQFKTGSTVLVTGGGAFNTFLLERVCFHKNIKIRLPDPKLIEFKEALIFGLLGVLRLEGAINCLSSVTGAQRDHSSGMIYHPHRP
ncbi:MAG: anhydro-N-acetylmuramic acid kinase [Flavobacteriales bacterium]|jgi:anhydro-N-acetylmuramic acid kinase